MSRNVNVQQIQDDRFVVVVPGFGEYRVSMNIEDYLDLGTGWKVLSSLFNVLADNEGLKSLPREFDALHYLNEYKEELKHKLANLDGQK